MLIVKGNRSHNTAAFTTPYNFCQKKCCHSKIIKDSSKFPQSSAIANRRDKMSKNSFVYLVYVENPFSGRVQLKKVCESLKLAKKLAKEIEEKKDTFTQIEIMHLEQEG